MAKGYHVLAGLCRDLRNAHLDAEENPEAGKLLDDFDYMLELLYDGSDGDVPIGTDSDDSTLGDDSDGESEPVEDVPRETRSVRDMGAGRQAPAVDEQRTRRQFSTRTRLVQEARPRPGATTCRIGRGGKR